MWEALMVPATARVTLDANGRVEVASATSDIGTGTYTIMAQIVADTLGVPPDKITVKLGDSDLPTAPVQGGSFTAASVGAAIQLACHAIAEQLLKAASKMNGKPLGSAKIDDIAFSNEMMTDKSDSSCAVALTDVMRASGEQSFQAEKTAKPGIFSHLRKSRHTHSAVFAEVRVDEDLGVIRVPRIVCAVAAGRILNPKTARSQIIGGVVWGLGMALHEETMMDYRLGRFMNHNLGEYHIPAHADIQDIDVIFVDEPDPEVSPLGIKGVGEIGVVGTAAAIANAIFHATGRRVRDLPITIDKLL
jgi:xanthine dehydrogenase YagR molybdenum-binding subunit